MSSKTVQNLIESLGSKTVMELRRLARTLELKGMSSARKDDLIPAISDLLHVELDKELAAEAKLAAEQAPKKAKRTMSAKEADMREAEDTNMHSDNGHAEYAAGMYVPEGRVVDDLQDQMQNCWKCHPEMDETLLPARKSATGLSKAGMTIHAKGSAEDKAAKVAEAARLNGLQAGIAAANGTLVLTVTGNGTIMELVWDAQGRYDYPSSQMTLEGKVKKIRNLSEALRLLNS